MGPKVSKRMFSIVYCAKRGILKSAFLRLYRFAAVFSLFNVVRFYFIHENGDTL